VFQAVGRYPGQIEISAELEHFNIIDVPSMHVHGCGANVANHLLGELRRV